MRRGDISGKKEFAVIRNPRYVASLALSPNKAVTYLHENDGRSEVIRKIEAGEEPVVSNLFSAYLVGGTPIYEFLSKSIKIVDVRIAGEKENDLVVSFQGDILKEGVRTRISNGLILLDRTRQAAIREFSGNYVDSSEKDPSQGEYVYTWKTENFYENKSKDSFSIPTKIVRNHVGADGYSRKTVTTIVIDPKLPLQENFQLSYFGFPEPKFSQPFGWLTLTVLGAIILSVGVCVLLFSRYYFKAA
jgi:hypothetical protein